MTSATANALTEQLNKMSTDEHIRILVKANVDTEHNLKNLSREDIKQRAGAHRPQTITSGC